MTNAPELYITDGTTRVDLLNHISGFWLKEWTPQTATLRGGGSRATPLFADGSYLTSHDYDNVIETLTLTGRWPNSDALAAGMIQLRQLLAQAADFWEEYNTGTSPVYLVARAYNETNRRYALIVQGRLPQESNPFSMPFIQQGDVRMQNEIDLIVERRQWQSSMIGSDATAMTIANGDLESGGITYDSRDYGADTGKMYLSALRNPVNITHIYYYNDSTASFGLNMMDDGGDFELFPPGGIETNDELYIGIEVNLALLPAQRFLNVVFDILTPISGGSVTLDWEYYAAGIGWKSFNSGSNNELTDGTDTFANSGINIITWEQGGDSSNVMSNVSVNGVGAYWIRATATVGAGSPSAPIVSQNTLPYTVTWPYFDVNAATLTGDLPTLLRWGLAEESSFVSPLMGTFTGDSIVMLSARKKSRGENFTPYILMWPVAGVNPSGISLSAGTDSGFSGGTDFSPHGSNCEYNPSSTSSQYQEVLSVTFDSTIASEYVGTFQAFLVTTQNGGTAGSFNFRLSLTYGGEVQWSAGPETHSIIDKDIVVPFGAISIGYGPGTTDIDEFVITLEATEHVTPTMGIQELILMPVDEWFTIAEMPYDVDNYTTQAYFENDAYIDIDSTNDPRDPRRTLLRSRSSDSILTRPDAPAGKINKLKPNTDHRLHAFAYTRSVISGSVQHLIRKYDSVFYLQQAKKINRYYSSRGAA